MPRNLKVPAYQLHKATGQAKVRIDGKDYYLGVHGTAASRERYDELITDWLARHSNPKRLTLTVGELVLMYLEHAREHYRKAGETTTSEFKCIKLALGHLVADHSRTPVREFGPKALKYVRDEMITAGYVRSSINRHIGRIRRVFACSLGGAFPGHRPERPADGEGTPSRPESGPREQTGQARPPDRIEALRPYVSRPIWGAIQVQLLTGMRPGEVLAMRGCDLNMILEFC